MEKETGANALPEDRTCEASQTPAARQNEDEAMDGDEAATVHPLLIEHVAKKTLSFFQWSYSNPKMLSCRLVCRTWCNIVTNGMKRRGYVRKLKFGYAESALMTKFLQDMRQSQNLPFDSFEFDVHFFNRRNTMYFREFLGDYSHCVRCLSLRFGTQFPMELREVLEGLTTNFGELRKLKLECTYLFTMQDPAIKALSPIFTWQPRHPRHLSQGLRQLLEQILDTAESLEEVEVCLPSRYFLDEDRTEVYTQFGDVLAEKLPDSVISLKLSTQLNPDHLSRLRRLRLGKLQLDFYGSHVTESSLQDFLRSQAPTVGVLRLVDFENAVACHQLPEMGKVTRFATKGKWLSSLRSFPRLEVLSLLTEPSVQDLEEHPKGKGYPSVTTLELVHPSENVSFCSSLPQMFPNLTKLSVQAIPYSVNALAAIFLHCGGLRELEVTFKQAFSKQPVDPLFTGLPLPRCYIIGENGMYGREDQDRILGEVNRQPNLENLRRLKKLVVKMESSAIILTDVTVHYALLRMAALEEIVFVGNHSISLDGYQQLKARFTVTQQQSSPGGHVQSLENSRALVPVLR